MPLRPDPLENINDPTDMEADASMLAERVNDPTDVKTNVYTSADRISDPSEDWGEDVDKRVFFSRLITLGYIWGIIAMIIGLFVFIALLLGWI